MSIRQGGRESDSVCHSSEEAPELVQHQHGSQGGGGGISWSSSMGREGLQWELGSHNPATHNLTPWDTQPWSRCLPASQQPSATRLVVGYICLSPSPSAPPSCSCTLCHWPRNLIENDLVSRGRFSAADQGSSEWSVLRGRQCSLKLIVVPTERECVREREGGRWPGHGMLHGSSVQVASSPF